VSVVDDPQQAMALHDLHGRQSLGSYLRAIWGHAGFVTTLASAYVREQAAGRALGIGWLLVSPLLLTGTYFFIFGVVFQVDKGVDHFIGYLVVGVLAFTWIIRSATSGAKALSGNRPLMHSLSFPRMALPLATAISEAVTFGVSLAIAALVAVLSGTLGVRVLAVVGVLAVSLLFTAGLGAVLSLAGSRLLDVQDALPYLMRIWFYFSGVLYPRSIIEARAPAWLSTILFDVNPGATITGLFRWCFGFAPAGDDVVAMFLTTLGWAVALLAGAVVMFTHREVNLGA